MAGTGPQEHSSPPPERVAHYRIVRRLGAGGMGSVYEADDEKLHRRVAIKSIHPELHDETHRRRFWREARSAARVNHPHVCQIYDVVETDGEIHIVMELLEGKPLTERIADGKLPMPQALQVGLEMVEALSALHERGIVHRDLKPSNVFLTAHGVKLLDFGLARPLQPREDDDVDITQEGKVLGTPRYMAPELWAAQPAVPQSDLFSVGAILFEMLSGTPAFRGRSFAAISWSLLHDEPPTLAGGPEVMATDRVIQRALAKDPRERYPSAARMARDLRRALHSAGEDLDRTVGTATRIVVAPFRLLRADDEIEFLSFGLPDAITTSLATVDSIVVLSGQKASRFADADLNFEALDTAGVDLGLTGTLLRDGKELRVTTQLIEVPSGELKRSAVSQAPLHDIFALQDRLAREILAALGIVPEPRAALQRDQPRDALAYEYYLRANKLAHNQRMLDQAVRLYRASLELDPDYAPAWARLGRAYRVMAKYEQGDRPEEWKELSAEAFERAFQLNPDLSIAHNLYTYFEIEELGRAHDSMTRLLKRAQSRTEDAQMFAALVVACRFCGLLGPSVAAHARARRLDPEIATSVQYTYWFMGDYERAIRADDDDALFVRDLALTAAGRDDEALQNYREYERQALPGKQRVIKACHRAALEGKRDECVERAQTMLRSHFRDPEGHYFICRSLARVGAQDLALETFRGIVERRFLCVETFRTDPWLDVLRDAAGFRETLHEAEHAHRQARETYVREGGESLLLPLAGEDDD